MASEPGDCQPRNGRSLRPQVRVAGRRRCAQGVQLGKALEPIACSDEEKTEDRDPTKGLSLVLLSIATSIDALAVGFSLSVIGVSIWLPSLIIGLVAGILTVVGMLMGGRIGDRWGSRVEIFGGVILICIGLKILAEHLLV